MSYSKVVNIALVFLLIPLILTACFSNSNEGKNHVNDAVENQLSRVNYNLSGSITLSKPDLAADSWQWEGYVHDQPTDIFVNATNTIAEQSNSLQLVYTEQDLYMHVPELNNEGEFFALDRTDQAESLNGFRALWSELGAAAADTDAQFFTQSNDEGSTSIEVTIEDEHKAPWYDAVLQSLAHMPFAQSFNQDELSEQFAADQALKEPGTFYITFDEQTQLTQLSLSLKSEQFELELEQSFTAAETTDPVEHVLSELPWEMVIEQYDELLSQQQAAADGIPFDEGVEFIQTYDYSGDPVRQSIFQTIEANLQALISNDKAAFDDTFRTETFAQRHEELFNGERKYRFLQIEDLQFKKLNNESIRVGVFFDYVDPGDSEISESGFVVTLRKNAEGTWKIDSIR